MNEAKNQNPELGSDNSDDVSTEPMDCFTIIMKLILCVTNLQSLIVKREDEILVLVFQCPLCVRVCRFLSTRESL